MKVSVYGESWASRIRQFWDDLVTSRHVRFLEAELARVRAEKDAEIQRLAVAGMEYRVAASQPQQLNRPIIPPMPLVSNYEAELARHNKSLEEEEVKEKSNGKH